MAIKYIWMGRECLAARRRFTRSKGDILLHEAWKRAKAALRRGMKKSRLQCWKDLIGEVEKDPWGLAFKIVTKKLVTSRKTPGLDNHDQVQYIVRNLFPHVELFERQNQSSCVVRREELFALEELKRAVTIRWGSFWRSWFYNGFRFLWSGRTVSRRTSSVSGKAGPL